MYIIEIKDGPKAKWRALNWTPLFREYADAYAKACELDPDGILPPYIRIRKVETNFR